MPYTVDPNDWLAPLDSQDAEQGAEEFRALKASLNEVRTTGGPTAIANATWSNLFDIETPMNVGEIIEFYVTPTNPAQYATYGALITVHKAAAHTFLSAILLLGTTSNIRVNGDFIQYWQNSGGALNVNYKAYGRKMRNIF